jgi:hypothetical protein
LFQRSIRAVERGSQKLVENPFSKNIETFGWKRYQNKFNSFYINKKGDGEDDMKQLLMGNSHSSQPPH